MSNSLLCLVRLAGCGPAASAFRPAPGFICDWQPVMKQDRPVTSESLLTARRSRKADAMPFQNQSMITFAAGQAKKMWPFIAGFGVVGYGVTVATLGITEEDKKKSGFLNPGGHH